jgi:hypothetical protein
LPHGSFFARRRSEPYESKAHRSQRECRRQWAAPGNVAGFAMSSPMAAAHCLCRLRPAGSAVLDGVTRDESGNLLSGPRSKASSTTSYRAVNSSTTLHFRMCSPWLGTPLATFRDVCREVHRRPPRPSRPPGPSAERDVRLRSPAGPLCAPITAENPAASAPRTTRHEAHPFRRLTSSGPPPDGRSGFAWTPKSVPVSACGGKSFTNGDLGSMCVLSVSCGVQLARMVTACRAKMSSAYCRNILWASAKTSTIADQLPQPTAKWRQPSGRRTTGHRVTTEAGSSSVPQRNVRPERPMDLAAHGAHGRSRSQPTRTDANRARNSYRWEISAAPRLHLRSNPQARVACGRQTLVSCRPGPTASQPRSV